MSFFSFVHTLVMQILSPVLRVEKFLFLTKESQSCRKYNLELTDNPTFVDTKYIKKRKVTFGNSRPHLKFACFTKAKKWQMTTSGSCKRKDTLVVNLGEAWYLPDSLT